MYKEKLGVNNLENILEEIVFKELYLIVQESDNKFCKCEICIQDISAIVLNSVSPMYENSEKDLPNDEKKDQHENVIKLVKRKLAAAIDQVTAAPHHHSMQIN